MFEATEGKKIKKKEEKYKKKQKFFLDKSINLLKELKGVK